MDHPPSSPSGSETRPVFLYDGRISELYGVFLLNLLLTIITFGVFRFWAITRLRRYLWSHMRFEGTRLTYTGKGKELFLGFLVAMVIFSIIGMTLGQAATMGGAARVVMLVLAYPAFMILFGAAHFSAQRYRLSRTEWRGIRGGMEGSAVRYGVSWMGYLLLSLLTLYQAIPWMQVGLARIRINATRFGSAVFAFEGRGRSLYPIWLGTWIGSLLLLGLFVGVVVVGNTASLSPVFSGKVTGPQASATLAKVLPMAGLGLIAFGAAAGLLATWYYASLTRLVIGGTSVTIPAEPAEAPIRFSSSVSAGSLLWLFVANALIGLFTLGLGLPIILHRSIRYFASTTFMTGSLDAHALLQSTQDKPAIGEGFLQALDPGVI